MSRGAKYKVGYAELEWCVISQDKAHCLDNPQKMGQNKINASRNAYHEEVVFDNHFLCSGRVLVSQYSGHLQAR